MWRRFQRRYENMYRVAIRKVLDKQLDDYLRNNEIDKNPLRKLMRELYVNTSVQWAAKIAARLPKRKARMPMGLNEQVIEMMRDILGINLEILVSEITATTIEYINEALSKGFELGWSIDRIVEELKKSGINAKRSRVIARTETVSAANAGGFLYANSQGYAMRKRWLTSIDGRERESHRIVSGSTIAMNEYFNVGTERMLHPGARKGPEGQPIRAREVVQCRCTLIYEVID